MKPHERLIALDIGSHRIGVAVSDELQMIASPETTITVSQTPSGQSVAIAEIVALVHRFNAGQVVAGLPRNMKGERGVQAQWTEAFVDALRAVLNPEGIYVALWDERLTSVQAEQSFKNEAASSRRKPDKARRQTVDARAAALILQGYLDRQAARRGIDGGPVES